VRSDICIYILTYIHICVHIHTHKCVHIYTHIHMHMPDAFWCTRECLQKEGKYFGFCWSLFTYIRLCYKSLLTYIGLNCRSSLFVLSILDFGFCWSLLTYICLCYMSLLTCIRLICRSFVFLRNILQTIHGGWRYGFKNYDCQNF